MASLVEKWREGCKTFEEGWQLKDAAMNRCADELEARDEKIRAEATKAGIAIRDMNTPRTTAETFINRILAILDGKE